MRIYGKKILNELFMFHRQFTSFNWGPAALRAPPALDFPERKLAHFGLCANHARFYDRWLESTAAMHPRPAAAITPTSRLPTSNTGLSTDDRALPGPARRLAEWVAALLNAPPSRAPFWESR
jgi:hypothetical protein